MNHPAVLATLILGFTAGVARGEPPSFGALDSLHTLGHYTRSYYTTAAVDVASMAGVPGGSQRWDFSYPRLPDEAVHRADIVSLADSGHAASFPEATYAAQVTVEETGARSWSAYHIGAEGGRNYFGFYDDVANPLCPLKVFAPPTVDLPAQLEFGQAWSRSTRFDDCFDAVFLELELDVTFTAEAQVDAWGTLVLPELGEMPALRINELHRYDIVDRTLGLLDGTQYFRNHYYVVAGIGIAVELISAPSQSVPPMNIETARTTVRVFQVRPWTVADLRIRAQDGNAVLEWRKEDTTSGYRVEAREALTSGGWKVRTEVSGNSWTEPIDGQPAHQFFRAFVEP